LFYEEILIFLTIFLSFCPPTYVHLNLQLSISLKPTKKESFKWNVFFTNFRFFWRKFSHSLSTIFSRNRLKQILRKKVKMFAFFVNKRNAKKFSAKFFFAINENFCETILIFAETLDIGDFLYLWVKSIYLLRFLSKSYRWTSCCRINKGNYKN